MARPFCALTLIFLLQYLGLCDETGSLISILSSAAPDRRLKFDVILAANDALRLPTSFLHSSKKALPSRSGLCDALSSSFSI